MTDYASVDDHRPMAQDAVRNAAYARALARVVTPDSVVLDLGAGTGLLGVIAARLGARRVYLVEPEDIIEVARQVAAANGVADRVVCLRGRIEDVGLPERVDVIVSVMTGNFLVTEDLLGTLVWARDHVLVPGGSLVPCGAAMVVAPVTAAAVHEARIASWSRPHEGLDLGVLRQYAANTVYYESHALRDAERLAPPQTLHAIDFQRDPYDAVHARVTCEIDRAGLCHGWAGWVDLDLGGERLSAAPFAPAVHWSTAFVPLDPPMEVRPGDRLVLTLDRVPHGDWTWVTEGPRETQQHSTLAGAPLSAATLERASPGYEPIPTQDGRAVLEILSACDGTTSVATLASRLHARNPARWPLPDALAFVQHTIRKFC